MKIKWCCLFLAQTVGLHFPSLLELEGAKGAMADVIDEDTRNSIIATPSVSASMLPCYVAFQRQKEGLVGVLIGFSHTLQMQNGQYQQRQIFITKRISFKLVGTHLQI